MFAPKTLFSLTLGGDAAAGSTRSFCYGKSNWIAPTFRWNSRATRASCSTAWRPMKRSCARFSNDRFTRHLSRVLRLRWRPRTSRPPFPPTCFSLRPSPTSAMKRWRRARRARSTKVDGVIGSDRRNIPLTDSGVSFQLAIDDATSASKMLTPLVSEFEKLVEDVDGHAFRAMTAYEKWMADGSEEARRELALLSLMGLFDRPATADCLQSPAASGASSKAMRIWSLFFISYVSPFRIILLRNSRPLPGNADFLVFLFRCNDVRHPNCVAKFGGNLLNWNALHSMDEVVSAKTNCTVILLSRRGFDHASKTFFARNAYLLSISVP